MFSYTTKGSDTPAALMSKRHDDMVQQNKMVQSGGGETVPQFGPGSQSSNDTAVKSAMISSQLAAASQNNKCVGVPADSCSLTGGKSRRKKKKRRTKRRSVRKKQMKRKK